MQFCGYLALLSSDLVILYLSYLEWVLQKFSISIIFINMKLADGGWRLINLIFILF